MSHIAAVETKPGEPMFADLDALRMAAAMCGGEIVEQSTYHWYGTSLGDYPLPKGVTKDQLGKNAKYVFRIKPEEYARFGIAPGTKVYELGLVEDPNNPGCYVPMYDYWMGGYGLDKAVGEPLRKGRDVTMLAPKLKQNYDMACDALAARAAGDRIEFLTAKDAHLKYPSDFPATTDVDTWVSIADPTQRMGIG